MEDKLTSRQKQALATKKKIYDVAMKLMKEVGMDGLTVQKICKHAGISVGAFYHHYKSLDFVITESYKNADAIFQTFREGFFDDESVQERILFLAAEQIKIVLENGVETISQVYKSQISMGSEYFGSWLRALPKAYEEVIIYGQQNGSLRSDFPAETITREIIIMIRGYIYDWCVHDGNYDLQDATQKAVSKFLQFYQTNE